MGLMALFESHRIAGPVYRFEKTLRALIDGDFSQRIRLRKYDNFTQLEPVLNQLADRYEQTSRAEQLVRARIGPGLEEVSKLLQQGHPEQARERIEVLQSEVRQVVGASA
jgi:methyl-accepting chemotaxis protein